MHPPRPLSALGEAVRQRLVTGFRSIVSGDPTGEPDWVQQLRTGDDEGYFGPASAVWPVHGDVSTLIGGVRALLLQTLHPAAVTGVDEHSSYREDALGRLAGTNRWLTVTTFGARAMADRESARVRGMHRKVVGSYTAADGSVRPYAAGDDRFLTWVHVAFTESFLVAHREFGVTRREDGTPAGRPFTPADEDDYVREWATAGELVGMASPPRSVAELDAEIDSFAPELVHGEATDRTLAFLRNPPLPLPARPGYAVLFAAAAATLRPEHRELLGLRDLGRRVPLAAGRTMLGGLRLVLGQGPPARIVAERRRQQAAAG